MEKRTVSLRATRGAAAAQSEEPAPAKAEEMTRGNSGGAAKPKITLRMRSSGAGGAPGDVAPTGKSEGSAEPPSEVRTPEQVKADGLLLWKRVVEHKGREGQLQSDVFMKLPSRKDYPDYYEVIKRPIAFADIKQKINHGEYATLRQIGEDIKQIFVNAKRYNEPGSAIYLDAKALHKTLRREFAALQGGASGAVDDGSSDEGGEPKRKKLKLRLGGKASATVAAGDDAASGGDEKPEPSIGDAEETGSKKDGGPPTVKAWLKEQLAALEEVKDHGRKLIVPFEDLPDRVEWKQYYDVIPNPIAFGMIRLKVEKRFYKDVPSFIEDVDTLFKNALYFNEDGSPIWRDAKTLQKRFESLMQTQPAEFAQPIKRGPYAKTRERERLRAELAAAEMTASPALYDDGTDAGTPMDVDGLGPPGDAQRSRSLSKGPAPIAPAGIPVTQQNLQRQQAYPTRGMVPPTVATATAAAARPGPMLNAASYMSAAGVSGATPAPAGTPGLTPSFLTAAAAAAAASGGGTFPRVQHGNLVNQVGPTLVNGASAATVPPQPPAPRPPPVRVVARLPDPAGPSAVTKFRVSTFPPCTLPLTLHNSIVHQHAVTLPRAASRLHIQASLHVFVSDDTKSSIRSSALGAALDDTDFDEEGGGGAVAGRKKKTRAQLHAEEEAAAQKKRKDEEEVEKLKDGPPPVARVEAKARPRQGVAEIDAAGSLDRKRNWADAVADGRSDVQGPTWAVELAPGSNVVELAATKPGDEGGKEVYRLFIMRAP